MAAEHGVQGVILSNHGGRSREYLSQRRAYMHDDGGVAFHVLTIPILTA